MKKQWVIFFILLEWMDYGCAQNLIPNSSFELRTNCPVKMAQLNLCKDWQSGNFSGTPDYFSINCSSHTLPDNYANHLSKPYSGEAYVGIATFYDQFYSYQEYIQVKLDSQLNYGSIYRVGMYIKLSKTSGYFTDRFHFCFSDTDAIWRRWIKGYDILYCNAGPLIKNEIGFKDTVNWVLIETTFQASGKEKYLTIGIFKNDMKRKNYKRILRSNKLFPKESETAYYFLDDVFLEEIK